MPKLNKATLLRNLKNEADQNRYSGTLPYSQCKALAAVINYVQRECGVIICCEKEVYEWLYFMASNPKYQYTKAKNFEHFCNIAMAQLRPRRLNKTLGFGKWLSFVEYNSRKAD